MTFAKGDLELPGEKVRTLSRLEEDHSREDRGSTGPAHTQIGKLDVNMVRMPRCLKFSDIVILHYGGNFEPAVHFP